MSNIYQEAADYISQRITDFPAIAVLTGTGLGSPPEAVNSEQSLRYRGIPNFPTVSGEGHNGELSIITLGGARVALFSGRLHYYEGHEISACGFPVQLMSRLGVTHLIMSNVSGSVNDILPKGSLALIRDHINLMGVNPLRGQHNERGTISFPEMRQAYATEYHDALIAFAKMSGISLQEAVYAAFAGPSLETPQEYKMVSILGGDLVGMSTVPEVIVAAALGIKTNVVSLVSNECFRDEPEPTSIKSVLEVAEQKRGNVYTIIGELARIIASES